MKPTAEDFRKALNDIFQQETNAGQPYVSVVSKNLHKLVGGYPAVNRMPLCCNIMREAKRDEDTIISESPSGLSTTLEIKYLLPRYVAADYIAALKQIEFSLHQIRLLQTHYSAPRRTLTATQMARAMGYKSYTASNLHYGHIGKMVGQRLVPSFLPEQTVFVLVTFAKPGKEWLWTMRPAFAKALEQLKLVSPEPVITQSSSDIATLRFLEGHPNTITATRYERNSRAREECLLHYGPICSVCGINLAEKYGDIAQGYVHVHHLAQLADINEEYKVDPITDLRPVCPNCHAVIHMRNPPFTIEEVKKFIADKKLH